MASRPGSFLTSVEEWRRATRENKLATCADFLAVLWEKGRLAPKIAAKIGGVDDLRGPANELVIGLDKALEAPPSGTPDPNVAVKETAVLLMTMMGWTK